MSTIQHPVLKRLGAHEVAFVGSLPGGSGAFLATDRNNQRWVIKLTHNRQGDDLLNNEVLGAFLLHAVGLPCLPWRKFGLSHFDVHGHLLTDATLISPANKSTTHFASLYIGEPDYVTSPIGPSPEDGKIIDAMLGIFVFDLWAGHADSREVMLAFERRSARLHVYAMDNGHLFYGPRLAKSLPAMSRVTLRPAMRKVVAQRASLPQILSWAERLQRSLPIALDLALGREASLRSSTLGANRGHFAARLNALKHLARTEWERQCSEPIELRHPIRHLSFDSVLLPNSSSLAGSADHGTQ